MTDYDKGEASMPFPVRTISRPDPLSDPAVLAAMPEVQALIAAAVQAAAKAAGTYCWNRYAPPQMGGQLSSPAVFTSHTHQDIERAILGTVQPDAIAALAAREAAARREGWNAAIEAAANRMERGGLHTIADRVAAILAMKETDHE
jgi:hypothetical protein